MQSPSSNTNNPDTKSSVHKGFIQIRPFKRRHSAVFSSFAVEDEVRCHDSSTDDSCAIDQLLGQVALRSIGGLLHVGATECILEGLPGFGEDGGRGETRLRLSGLERRVVDEASGVRGFRQLTESRRNGKGASQEERHVRGYDNMIPMQYQKMELSFSVGSSGIYKIRNTASDITLLTTATRTFEKCNICHMSSD